MLGGEHRELLETVQPAVSGQARTPRSGWGGQASAGYQSFTAGRVFHGDATPSSRPPIDKATRTSRLHDTACTAGPFFA